MNLNSTAIEDYQWLNTDEAHAAFRELLETNETGSLGIQHADSRVRSRRLELLKTQVALQKACAEKFPNPEMWFWTKKHLEQSSDLWCALETAQDIPIGSHVVDLCSGAGADAIAIALSGHQVHSYDIDPIAHALLQGNANRNEVKLDAYCQPAEAAVIGSASFLHIDPDRRSGGARVTSSQDFQPAWSVIQPMIHSASGASVKVAPATRLTEDIPAPDVVRFLSRNRSVRQQRWLWNQNRWPANSLVVSAYHLKQWHHEVFENRSSIGLPIEELQGNARSPANSIHQAIRQEGELGEYLGDYDPAIRSAGVSLAFSEKLATSILGPNGYLTHSEPVPHSMVRWFQVLETLPMDRKKLVAYSRSKSVRLWELKSRGVEFPLDPLRKALITCPESDEELTILFTKVAKRNLAIVATPL